MPKEEKIKILKNFKINGNIITIDTLGAGFINDTFIVETDIGKYILQLKNNNVFKDIPAMMNNIVKVTNHLKEKIICVGGDYQRETLTVVETKNNKPYYKDDNGDYWTVCLYIDNSKTYDSVNSVELAYKGGEAIGEFQYMLSDFRGELVDILPGFHDIRYRFKQWEQSIKNNSAGRVRFVRKEIGLIESLRGKMLAFKVLLENGIIPARIAHNDTKISNILFDAKDNALCMIDLDTVMISSSLFDFGDAVRSYTNTGAEDSQDLNDVEIDINIYENLKQGYLVYANKFLTEIEIELLPFAALYITYEQVLRFLMDYIDGDIYYKTSYEDHNLVRAKAQYKLFCSMESYFQSQRI